MAEFTELDDKTPITQLNMRVDGKKRLHLADAGGKRDDLKIVSTKTTAVTGKLVALYDGPKGIWTVDLKAEAQGKAEIQAKLKDKVIARLSVTVEKKLALPEAAKVSGMLARLFLAESRTPSQKGYDAKEAKTGMQWMRRVLVNRLRDNPKQFGAPGAKTLFDIVKAKGQFKGFESYPNVAAPQKKHIEQVLETANNDNHSRQADYEKLVLTAREVAMGDKAIEDPCPTGLYGWRTAGSSDPGGRFKKYKTPLSGNQFYTLEKEEDKK